MVWQSSRAHPRMTCSISHRRFAGVSIGDRLNRCFAQLIRTHHAGQSRCLFHPLMVCCEARTVSFAKLVMPLPHWLAHRSADETTGDLRKDTEDFDARFQRTAVCFMSCKTTEFKHDKLTEDCPYLKRANPARAKETLTAVA